MYTSDTYLRRHSSFPFRSAGDPTRFPTLDGLNAMVDAFAAEMKKKLQAKFTEGYEGWDDPKMLPILKVKLMNHAEKPGQQVVDIANLAAMIWNIETNPSPTSSPINE